MRQARLALSLVVLLPLAANTQPAPPPAGYLAALGSAGRGDWPAARQGLEQTIQREPHFGPAYRKLGQIAAFFRAVPDATAFFESLTRVPATASSGWLGLGWIAFDRRDWDEAIRLSGLAVQSQPAFAAPYLLWNRALVRRKSTALAAAHYQAWMRREPAAVLPKFAWHHLRVWSGQRSAEDLDQLQRLHGGNRDLLEAWMLSEYSAGERTRALTAVREVIAAAVRGGDPELAYTASAFVVGILSDLSLNREAAIAAEQAQPGAVRFGDNLGSAYLALQACTFRLDLGDVAAAYRLCGEAARRATATPGAESIVSDALTRLANIEESRGQFDLALSNLEAARDWGQRSGFPLVAAIRQRDMALLLMAWGQPSRAEALLRQALATMRAEERVQTQSQTLATLARCTAAQGRMAEARRYFDEALALARGKGDRESERIAWTEMAIASAQAGDAKAAGVALTEAIASASKQGNRAALASLLASAGQASAQARQWGEAERRFEESLEAARASGRQDVEWEAQFGLGLAAENTGRPAGALAYYLKAIESSEQLRERIPDPGWRAPFFASRQEMYQRAIGLLVQQGSREAAFALVERSRARALLDVASGGGSGAAVEMDARGRELAAELALAERNLLETTLSQAGPAAGETERQRTAAHAADAAYHLHASRVRRGGSGGQLIAGQPASLDQIQERLAADTALLTYSIGPTAGQLFVVTRGGLSVHAMPSAAALGQRTGELSRLLSRPPERLTSARLTALLAGFYRDLVAPAEASLRNKTKWLVSTAGPLQRIPFAALLDPSQGPSADFSKAPFLLRRVAISQVPSATVWLRLQDRRAAGAAAGGASLIAAIADAAVQAGAQPPALARSIALGPLPGARREAVALGRIYRDEPFVALLGGQATEAETVRLLSRARVAHLAVHGVVDFARPQSSALLLAKSESDNGLLQAYEIQNLRLPNLELVVLPACQTLAGQDMPGEGVQALAGSFLLAGAAEVIGSLWRVADSATAGVMIALHGELRKGKRPSQALRVAQLTALQTAAYSHPYYWAGFQLVGGGT